MDVFIEILSYTRLKCSYQFSQNVLVSVHILDFHAFSIFTKLLIAQVSSAVYLFQKQTYNFKYNRIGMIFIFY